MTFKELAKQLTAAVQTVPNLVNVLRDGFEQMEGGSSSGYDYSTDEKKVGKWIDGKDLYQITVSGDMPSDVTNGTYKNSFIDIDDLGIGSVVSFNAVMFATDSFVPLFFNNQSNYGSAAMIMKDSDKYKIRLSTQAAAYGGKTVYVTIQYTKA